MQQPGMAANEGKRSSVMDRIRWIEKTHGPTSNSAPAGQQRAKLRLPKHFEAQPAEATASPPSNATALPVTPKVEEPTRIPPRQTQPSLQTVVEAQQMPSPVLSETGSLVTSAAVGENGGRSPMTSLRQLQHSQLQSPRQEEPNHQLSTNGKSANNVHSRNTSTESSASEAAMAEHALYGNQSSSSSDIELHDPVPATPGDARAEDPAEKEPRAGRHHPRRSLGGIRSRAPPASSRKYHKFQQADEASSVSLHSANDEEHPTEDSAVSGESAPALRSTKSLTSVVSTASDRSRQRAEDKKQVRFAEGQSLLSRLASLTANRPNVQDLVSNRSSPKFVKRSHHFSSSPVASATTHGPIVWSRSTERRRYK
ncbi:hypothetical protein H4R20_003767 [Coemansia guatemalensis]|uniref:Uncharacterized protein n=1 Tax=Coemansia guatemalensis TaxID=2761395 RepID=A0A9W8HUL7_9FUNG|nr:hypothetical protein H4R20_003767 [Coemansia guatemalensis]